MDPDSNLSAAQFGLGGPLGSSGQPSVMGAGTGGTGGGGALSNPSGGGGALSTSSSGAFTDPSQKGPS
jgi:hypothetical protein